MPDFGASHPIYWPIAKLRAAYARGDLAPADVLTDVFARIAAYNPKLHAFLSVLEPLAREQAEAARRAFREGRAGPLAGVPISIKDTFDIAGEVTTRGSLIYRNAIAASDSGVVRRLRAAGAMFVGKTNTAEFGQSATTDNRLGEDCRNPWDLKRTPGGSSGGAAASVAAGLATIALGADGGGSIRIPAAFTGIVGFKPTMGACRDEGGFAAMSEFCCPGPLAWRVADARVFLGVLAEHDFVRRSAPRRLRIAWCARPQSHPVEGKVAAAVANAMKTVATLGFQIEDVDLPLDGWNDAFGPLVLEEEHRVRGHLLAAHRDRLTDYERMTLEAAADLDDAAIEEARGAHRRYRKTLDRFFESYDVIATPATAVPAFPLGQRPREIAGERVSALWGAFPFTAPFNVAGNPAVSLPCGFADELPVGLQLVGARHDDHRLLDVAQDVEEAIGFDASEVLGRFRDIPAVEGVP